MQGLVRTAIAAGVVASIAGVAVAYASIPDGKGVIHGCYTTTSPHSLRVIDTATTPTCPSGTTPISWNQRGRRGIQGPPGLSNFTTVTSSNPVPAGNIGSLDVACPSGETAISGGYSVPYTATVLEATRPRIPPYGGQAPRFRAATAR